MYHEKEMGEALFYLISLFDLGIIGSGTELRKILCVVHAVDACIETSPESGL